MVVHTKMKYSGKLLVFCVSCSFLLFFLTFLLARFALRTKPTIERFITLIDKVKKVAMEQEEEEADLGEVPDEFLGRKSGMVVMFFLLPYRSNLLYFNGRPSQASIFRTDS